MSEELCDLSACLDIYRSELKHLFESSSPSLQCSSMTAKGKGDLETVVRETLKRARQNGQPPMLAAVHSPSSSRTNGEVLSEHLYTPSTSSYNHPTATSLGIPLSTPNNVTTGSANDSFPSLDRLGRPKQTLKIRKSDKGNIKPVPRTDEQMIQEIKKQSSIVKVSLNFMCVYVMRRILIVARVLSLAEVLFTP